MVTMILNKFPSAKVFYEECCQHDMDFHHQIGFEKSNKKFLKGMRKKSWKLDCNYFKKLWFYSFCNVIYWFVAGKKGREAYRKGACPVLMNKEVRYQ
jgi:hypothetical protein